MGEAARGHQTYWQSLCIHLCLFPPIILIHILLQSSFKTPQCQSNNNIFTEFVPFINYPTCSFTKHVLVYYVCNLAVSNVLYRWYESLSLSELIYGWASPMQPLSQAPVLRRVRMGAVRRIRQLPAQQGQECAFLLNLPTFKLLYFSLFRFNTFFGVQLLS